MIKTESNRVLQFSNRPVLLSGASIGGKTEGEGPMKNEFDRCYPTDYINCKTWEQAESALQHEAVQTALQKAKLDASQIGILFAGDLLDQCMASAMSAKDFNIPMAGLYGACSTFALGLALAAVFTDCNAVKNAIAVASSHFCSAEKQFRFPLEYGNQRTPTTQRTATAAGAVVVGHANSGCCIESAMIGTIRDLGITDAANMGAAMAPAAADTVEKFLFSTKTQPRDYDCILTGDLGAVGSQLLCQLLFHRGLDISAVHEDCGNLLFDNQKQDVHAGASGCGCSASLVSTMFRRKIENKELQKVLFVGTGALMSPLSVRQGESIPGIAHAVLLSNK